MSNFLAVCGQLLWFLQAFLPFEAKNGQKNASNKGTNGRAELFAKNSHCKTNSNDVILCVRFGDTITYSITHTYV